MEVIGEVQKNMKEKIVVSNNEYQGHKYVDVRIYYKDMNDEYKPSKKGIALSPKVLNEVMELIVKGAETL